jgi:hypothetical protein
LLPALALPCISFGWIFGTLVLARAWASSGLAGARDRLALHFLIQLPCFPPARAPLSLHLGLHINEVREVARLMGRVCWAWPWCSQFLLNTILSSSQPQGSLSGLSLPSR